MSCRMPSLIQAGFSRLPVAAAGMLLLLWSAGAAHAASPDGSPAVFRFSLAEASLMALQNHAAFRVEQLRPEMFRRAEAEERAVFDPALVLDASRLRADGLQDRTTESDGMLSVEQLLPTGTRLSAGWGVRHYDASLREENETYAGRYGLTVSQPLLRGRGSDVQRARLSRARYDVAMSEQVLRGAAEALVALVEQAAWNYVLAGRRIAIYEESLRIAEDQFAEVEERIRLGRLADIERAAMAAEVAQRREELINARAAMDRSRLDLVRLVGPGQTGWDTPLEVTDQPIVPDERPQPVGVHVEQALAGRPDLQEARLLIEREDVEIVRTRNGLLPRLDAFISLGRTGYADSFSDAHVSPARERDTVEAGVRMVYTLGRRGERAAHERSLFSHRMAEEALRNMQELVEVEVRAAHIEMLRTRDQIAATRATRDFREESYRAESEKLRVGRSTSLLVAQTQRDLVAARIAEVEAVVNHLKARLLLERLDATLLPRRGLSVE